MKLITVDFEVFWDANHTLSKMSPIAYVMDSKSQLICMGIKIGDGETQVVFGEHKIREVVDNIDWSNAYVIGHNMSGFDSMILAWRLGVKPKLWGCTLAMARPIHAKTIGNSLEKLVQHYGIGVKDKTALVNTKGKRLEDFTADEIEAMAKYNAADVDQCYQLFTKLRPFYTAKELWLIDATIRMLVEPMFVIDRNLLESALAEERKNKRKAIMAVADHLQRMGLATDEMVLCTTEEELEEAVRKALASANKFAVLLESLGVEVPMKPSPTNPDKLVPALAKTDEEFQKLKEHDNPVVAAAVRARLAVRSTILETRIETFMEISDAVGGKLPVALHYCGADTTGRWSGWSGNIQNLPRITPDKPKPSDALRKSMRAPEGYKVIVADQSGIELRVNHFLWKVPSSMALYKKDRKADLYKAFAAVRYGISPEEVTKEQRQLAKLCQLGLGFGCGWKKFKLIAKTMGGLDLSDAEAEAVTTDWRNSYPEIVRGWRVCHEALQWIHDGVERPIDPWGLCWTSKHGIRLPSGRFIRYSALHLEKTSDGNYEWWYGQGRHRTRVYAGKVTENCLAEGTLVLTGSGWKPIEEVTKDDSVYDGVEFVKHDGVVCNSVQKCIELDGVWLTPNHMVLTDEGWKEASQLVQTDNSTVTEKPVYDIVNCGPRHRFVVKGKTGPFIVHNCVQAIARDIIADNMFSFYKETGLYPALMVHDELVYVVPENQAEKLLDKLQQIMRTPPQWWPDIVLESEGDIADTYGDAK